MSFLDQLFADVEKRKETKTVCLIEEKKRKEPPKIKEEETWDQSFEKFDKKKKLEKAQQTEDKKRKNLENLETQNEVLNEMCMMFNRPPPRKKGAIDLGDKPYIDTIQKCKIAVEELMVQDIIAVDCEWAGPRDVPRSQDLCILQIANSKERAYIFDIYLGGKDFFDKGGLKGLLENPKILKIFHDCRWDSDILWHKMGVKLQNVFDTQVGYACYHRQQEQHFTPLPVGLKNLIKRFTLGGSHKSKDEAREDMDNKEDYWKIRPLTELMLQYAREDVLLLPLVYRQINAVYSPSSRAVALKNSAAYVVQKRDKTTEELQKELEAKEKSTAEGVRFVPLYGIPEWDKAAMNSLQRMNRRNF